MQFDVPPVLKFPGMHCHPSISFNLSLPLCLCSGQLDLEGAAFELPGLSSLSSLHTLSLGENCGVRVDNGLDAVRLRCLFVEFEMIETSYGRIISAPQLSGLTALSLGYVDVHMADLTAMRQLTGLTCLNLFFPDISSNIVLPEMRHVKSIEFHAYGPVSRAVALTLPGLESLDTEADELSFLDVPGLWPTGLRLQKLTTLRVAYLSDVPMDMLHACAAVLEKLDTWYSCITEDEWPCLRVLGNALLKLNIHPCHYELLPEVVRACPHLTDAVKPAKARLALWMVRVQRKGVKIRDPRRCLGTGGQCIGGVHSRGPLRFVRVA